MNKRKRKLQNDLTNNSNENTNKKSKKDLDNFDYVIDDKWIPISKTRNASLKDYCMDWFDMYNIKNIDDKPIKKSVKIKNKEEKDTFLSFLLTKGCEFENKIITIIKDKFPNDFIQIANSYEAKQISKYKDTISAMKNNIPIIYQGVLHNTKNRTYGCPDLIIRTDFLNKIFTNVPVIEDNKYCIIDIKWSQIHFNSNMITIRNSLNVKPFKTQIILYNIALGQAFYKCGFQFNKKYPNYCYILGKGWLMERSENKKKIINISEDPFDRLGVIDIEDNDKDYIDVVNESLIWYRKLITDGDKWTINPPSNNYLFPNMCNTLDTQYHKLKLDIAEKIFEITHIWQCGVNHRENAINNNIYSWNDPSLTTEILGVKGDYTKKIVNKILEINRNEYKDIIYPKKFKDNTANWKSSKLKLYIDFETISGIFFDKEIKHSINDEKNKEEKDKRVYNDRVYKDILFMIGLVIRNENEIKNENKIKNEKFILNDLSINNRKELILNFIKKINNIATENKWNEKTLPLFHYGSFENSTFYKTCKFLNINVEKESKFKLKFIDLSNILRKETFSIKGALNYSLKSIVKAMYKNNISTLNYETKEEKSVKILTAEDAMYYAWKYYTDNTNNKNENIIDGISKYNTIDCLALDEIMMSIMMKRK